MSNTRNWKPCEDGGVFSFVKFFTNSLRFITRSEVDLQQNHQGVRVQRCRNPTLAKRKDETHTPKVGDLESFGTPKSLEFDSKGKNTSSWGVFGVVGKVLKCRCLKWPCIGHLDICSPSYGQKKGRESNWQFDSRPLKVRNRPAPNVRWRSAMQRWKALEKGYKFGWDLVSIGGWGEKLWCPKVSGVQNRDSFGSPKKKCHSDASATERHREYYREDGGGTSRVRAVVCHVSPS
jgi:hypothetical protein